MVYFYNHQKGRGELPPPLLKKQKLIEGSLCGLGLRADKPPLQDPALHGIHGSILCVVSDASLDLFDLEPC